MTLPFKVPLTDVSRIKGNWIDLWNNMVNRLLKVTLQAFCEGGGQDVRDEALKIAEDCPGVCPRQS